MDKKASFVLGLKRAVALDLILKDNLNCPNCGNGDVAKILYGLVNGSNMEDEFSSNSIYMAGCDIPVGDDPVFYCNRCQTKFGNRTGEYDDDCQALFSKEWQLFRNSQSYLNVTILPLVELDKFSLDEIVCQRESIPPVSSPDIVINRFYCDWQGGLATWFWLYRQGDIFRIDSELHRLFRDTEYLKMDDYIYNSHENQVVFDCNTIVEVSVDEFEEQLNAQLFLKPQRRVQVVLACYRGPDSLLWKQNHLYEVELLFDHMARVPDQRQGWHYLELTNYHVSRGRVEMTDVNQNWFLFYEEFVAKKASDLSVYKYSCS